MNLNRRPVKMWLFNLVSEIEVLLGEFLSRRCGDEEIYELSLGCSAHAKHDAVKRRYQADRKKGLELPVAEYLYFSDLVSLVSEKGLQSELKYSRTRFDHVLGSLVELRDELAHPARSLIREPGAVCRLWGRVQRIEDVLARLRGPTNP